jgi:hypothetical protein
MAELGWKAGMAGLAPAIGAALPLPPPLGNLALGWIADKVLGKPNASEKDVQAALDQPSPATIDKLKQADKEFAAEMQRLDVDLERLRLDHEKAVLSDIAGARAMRIATGDGMLNILAILVTLGFFGMLVALILVTERIQMHEPLLILLGSLGTAWTTVIAFFFGSSAGSKRKTEMLRQ